IPVLVDVVPRNFLEVSRLPECSVGRKAGPPDELVNGRTHGLGPGTVEPRAKSGNPNTCSPDAALKPTDATCRLDPIKGRVRTPRRSAAHRPAPHRAGRLPGGC